MTNQQIEKIVQFIRQQFKKENVSIFSIEAEPDPESGSSYYFKIYVPRHQVEMSNKLLYSTKWINKFNKFVKNEKIENFISFYIYESENTPLVPANLGNFVLTHSTVEQDDELCSVAIVTKITIINDKKIYNVRELIPKYKYIFSMRCTVEKIEITKDDYSGTHEGFLKILTPQEAKSLLVKQYNHYHNKYIKKLKEEQKDIKQNVNKLIDALNKNQIKCTSENLFVKEYCFEGLPSDFMIREE